MSSTQTQFRNEDPNIASSEKWRLMIGNLILLTRRIHDFSVPGIYSEGVDGPSPGDVMYSISSERVTFDPVVFTFVIDESWYNWQTIYDWIRSNANKDLPVTHDIIIELLDGVNNPTGFRIVLTEARATGLDNVLLDVDGEVPRLVCTVTIKYQDMTPERS